MRRTRIRTLLLVVLVAALTLGGLREWHRCRTLAVRREYVRAYFQALDATRQVDRIRQIPPSRRGP